MSHFYLQSTIELMQYHKVVNSNNGMIGYFKIKEIKDKNNHNNNHNSSQVFNNNYKIQTNNNY